MGEGHYEYCGVTQARYGHEFRALYRMGDSELKEILDANGVDAENDWIDVCWPYGGHNSSATLFEFFRSGREAAEFLEARPFGPDSDDPSVTDIAEYMCAPDEGLGCTAEFISSYHLDRSALSFNAPQYARLLEILKELNGGTGGHELFYDDRFRDLRISELEEAYGKAFLYEEGAKEER